LRAGGVLPPPLPAASLLPLSFMMKILEKYKVAIP
jgi:hypothetical protein